MPGDGMEMHVSAPDLRKLYADLKAVDGNLRAELRRGIREAGQGVADAVKAQASWSSRIPGAVRVKPSFGARTTGLAIEVDGKKAPHAKPLDRGSSGRDTTFGGGVNRHPVFGRGTVERDKWTWVNQPTRPFFDAAVRARTPDIERRIAQVADDVARKAGFH